MVESDSLAGWLMLSCLSLFTAVMIVVACTLGIYLAEGRHYTKLTGEPSTIFDEIYEDFGPKTQALIKRKLTGAAPAPPPP